MRAGLPHAPRPTVAPTRVLASRRRSTTGNPKGVMLSHRNILASIGNAGFPEWAIFNLSSSGPQEVHISYLPLALGEWVRDNTVQAGRDLLARAVPGPVKAVLVGREAPATPPQRSFEDLREFSQGVSFKAPTPAPSSTES